MATAAETTKGVEVQVEDTPSSGTFTKIAEVKSFDGPNRTNPDLDASSFDSTEMEFVGGLANPGQFNITMNHLSENAEQQRVEDDVVTGTKRNYKLVFPSGQIRAFLAKVSSYSPSGNMNAIIEAKVGFQISGTITRTDPP